MSSNKSHLDCQNRQKIHQILTNQTHQSPFQHYRQNSDNIKFWQIPQQDKGTPLNIQNKSNDQNVISKNLTKQKHCHHKHGSLDFEPFQFNNAAKVGKFTQIRSSRQKRINHFDVSKEIHNINNCYQENVTETFKTDSLYPNKHKYDEKILDLLLLNTVELKEILSVNNEKPLKTQRIRPKITFIQNTKALPHDFFFPQ